MELGWEDAGYDKGGGDDESNFLMIVTLTFKFGEEEWRLIFIGKNNLNIYQDKKINVEMNSCTIS